MSRRDISDMVYLIQVEHIFDKIWTSPIAFENTYSD